MVSRVFLKQNIKYFANKVEPARKPDSQDKIKAASVALPLCFVLIQQKIITVTKEKIF